MLNMFVWVEPGSDTAVSLADGDGDERIVAPRRARVPIGNIYLLWADPASHRAQHPRPFEATAPDMFSFLVSSQLGRMPNWDVCPIGTYAQLGRMPN